MLRKKLSRLTLLLLFFTINTRAAENIEILVEDSLIQEDFTKTSPAVSVIEASEIKKNNLTSIADILNTLPGISVTQNGGINQSTSVFIRGAESRHTLVLIDNIEINDPLNPSRAFDFSGLTTENIERIEVFKGAQSVRFGSDAIGGVINIITKEGKSPLSGSAQFELGSYNTSKAAIDILGAKNQFRYSMGTAYIGSTGFSSADKNNGNSEADGFNRLSWTSRFGWIFSNITNINFTLRATGLQSDLDAFGGPGGDDPNSKADTRQLQFGSLFKSRALDDKLSYSLGYGLATSVRTGENSPDIFQPDESTDYFSGVNSKIEFKGEYTLSDFHQLQFGTQLRNETGRSESSYNGTLTDLPEQSSNSKGVFALHKYESEKILTEIGIRHDDRDKFGAIVNYSLHTGYKIPNSEATLFFNYGTGFKTPSLYQLYSSYGNRNLSEEKSNSVEFSLEKKWGSDFFTSAAYFVNQYNNLIDFDGNSLKYFNIAKSSSRGLELQTQWKPTEFSSLKVNLTHLNSQNEITGDKLLRRPEISMTTEASYKYENLESSLQYSYYGRRTDIDPVSFLPTPMPDYDLVNLRFHYTATSQLSYNARIINLFNRQYQSSAGYGSAELSLYAGVTKSY